MEDSNDDPQQVEPLMNVARRIINRREFLKILAMTSSSLLAAAFRIPSRSALRSAAPPVIEGADRLPSRPSVGPAIPQFEHISTSRLVQLTGDYDPEGLSHFNSTGAWGVEGVDLGANTEHDGKLFFFFGDVPLTQAGFSWPPQDADLIAFIDRIDIPPGAHLAAAKQLDNQLDVFFIGNDGGLYVSWAIDGDVWQGPVRISPPDMAPPGVHLVAAKQLDNQLDVFFIGNDGRLYVSWAVGGDVWQGPVGISPANIAPPGADLAAAKQLDNQLDVFFIGNDGRLYVSWAVGGDVWQGPVGISPASIAPPGANLTAAKQLDNQLDVFFIGSSGGLYVSWAVGGGVWQGPVGITPANIAPPGAHLAAAKQLDNQLDVFFIGNSGGLYVSWAIGADVWQGPVGITPASIAPPGAGLAAAKQLDNQLDVFFIGNDGRLYVSWAIGGDVWQGPVGITPASIAPPGAHLAAANQLVNQLDVFFIGSDGGLYVSWAIGGDVWQGPVRIIPAPFRLTPVLENKRFYPFSYRKGNQILLTLGVETPTGAFSYGGKVYVFFVAGKDVPASSLSVTIDPGQPVPYDWLFDLSSWNSQSGRFLQVAPWVVSNADIPGLPSTEGDGLILFGHGLGQSGFGVHLAWMPLQPGQDPRRADVLFYTGISPNPWSPNEADAKTLFLTRFGWTSLSVGRIRETGQWILLNQKAGSIEDNQRENTWDEPVVARIAPTPWDIELAGEIAIFSPAREGARGKYMAPDSTTFPNWPPIIRHPSFAYGAYLLNPYTQWNAEQRILTITYLMSTGCPYQVQVMQSRLFSPPDNQPNHVYLPLTSNLSP